MYLDLLYFLMAHMLSAKRTKLLKLNTLRMQFFILIRNVISLLACRTFKLNKLSHFQSLQTFKFTPTSPR